MVRLAMLCGDCVRPGLANNHCTTIGGTLGVARSEQTRVACRERRIKRQAFPG